VLKRLEIMFTGLIQDIGIVASLTRGRVDAHLAVDTSFDNFAMGESIAIMGACLSVTAFEKGRFTAFASVETLEKTGIGAIVPGTRVNLERALRAGDALGGHLVTGHVDARVTLVERRTAGGAERLAFSLPKPPLARQIAPKGSVALDGVSLTINEVKDDRFTVVVIPITLKETTLCDLKKGDKINLETDVLAKYIARQLEGARATSADISLELLERNGFMR
jgi:riboflavin synthase